MAIKDKAAPPRAANLSPAQVAAAIPKLERRLAELLELDPFGLGDDEARNALISVVRKTNATLIEIFGLDTYEFKSYVLSSLLPQTIYLSENMDRTIRGNLQEVRTRIGAAVSKIKDIIAIFQERLEDGQGDTASRTLRAYQGLELHPEVARAASDLY